MTGPGRHLAAGALGKDPLMPWWLRTIFPALLASFAGGLALGLGLWWAMRRRDLAELDRRRLEAEAEGDRLRLRLASLKESQGRVAELERQLADTRQRLAGQPAD